MRARRTALPLARRLGASRARAALTELRDGLQGLYGRDAPSIVVYGSYARAQARRASDIDVLLVYVQQVKSGYEIRRVSPILADLNLRYGVLISVLPVNVADYNKAVGAFWQNVRREGVGIESI